MRIDDFHNKITTTVPGLNHDLVSLVRHASRKDLEAFLLEMAGNDPMTASRLLLTLGEQDVKQQSEEWHSMIRHHLRLLHGNPRSFDDNSIGIAMQGANEVFYMAQEFLRQGKWEHALFAALNIYEEMVEVLPWADGWDEIHEMIRDCSRIMEDAAVEMNPDELSRSMSAVLEMIQYADFHPYDEYALEPLVLCAKRASTGQQAELVRDCAKSFLSGQSNGDGIPSGTFENLYAAFYEMYVRLGDSLQARELRREHRNLSFFRRLSIEEAVRAGDLAEAEFLCCEAMEAYRNRPGYASRWEDMLADIYLQSGQLKEWRMIIRSRAINGEWERYLSLKQSFTAPEWILQQRGFLDELQANHQGRSIYARVLINENLLDELLGWVRQQPDRIASYATYLHLHAPAEVESLYEKYINRLSVQVSKRSEYRELAREIGKFAGYSTPARADEIRGHIMQQNPRRRALREELAKIRLE